MKVPLTHVLRSGYGYVRKNPQFLMTFMLIIVIPVAFLLSGQQFLKAAQQNQERLEKDRIGIVHDVFASFLSAVDFEPERIQGEITHLHELNPDIIKFIVAKEEGATIRIIASQDTELVDTLAHDENSFRFAAVHPNESIITPMAYKGVRHWQSVRLVQAAGNNDYYIFTETSLEHIDILFASRIMTAYYWLIGILCVVMFLLIRHVRLIDYAYLYRETKKANEMKDMFTNMIAHELRAPLTAMRGYASLIRESKDTKEDVREHAKKIEDAAGRLVLVVSDLLDVARIHSGKLSVKKTSTNIQRTIHDVIDAMQGPAQEKNINLSQEGIRDDLFIMVDEKRLFQALTNLVSNSIKYTPAGSITVSLDQRTDRIEIRVKDTGTGISAENQKSLFSPFFRVGSDEVSQTVGTGLGMWITKQLIELMDGSIGVESIRDVGTHIVVTLPK
ncbi:MAG: HAMP domain-containing histidine kinase [Candidatus Pacebacteria bacterium]|nr:HAMP domain-containing histidine kinase [Candidatus Paceibacterota bacterium]MCF7857218.1 HAMP domain-containing histidine kinase [Candidatus Paceibacterota bacterium]